MGRITEELLRKRAEHNEGILSTMEEVSLHQQEIEKIENLEYYCRHLKILYLQNNIIEKLENLEKLKELEYLNLAVNSISKIENIEHCESLNKLDMTMNFVDIEDLKESCDCLSKCPSLRELYLTGNPCESFKYCKEYITARVPQLTLYNGNEILKSERIKAKQMLPMMEEELEKAAKAHVIFKQNDPSQKDPNHYSVEYRRKLYKDLENDRLQREKEKQEAEKKNSYEYGFEKEGPPSVYRENGEIRICNQGKYDVTLDEDIFETAITTFTIKLPKYMDTEKIKVDLNPQYVRIDANGKITQWRFDHEIMCESATIERSSTTGVLVIKAPIVGVKPREKTQKSIKEINKELKEKKEKKELKAIKDGVHFNRKDDSNQIKVVESFEPKHVDLNQISKECGVDLDEVPDLD